MPDDQFAAYEERHARAAALERQLRPANKAALFTALNAAGVTVVTITFDGCGDSGQFEAPDAFDAESKPIALPSETITVQKVDYTAGAPFACVTTVSDYLQDLACDFLEATHSGWEDGDGGFGTFTFDVTGSAITLNYDERYTETNNYVHEF